ncbi:MAG: domain S-box protein [Cytophagaceae bacterium]|jgi:PAS domain S-box-containing protein|nr:domain S-box protein [Cytophagaceae bacterium]
MHQPMIFLTTIWTKMISVGYTSDMDYSQQTRLFTINAFLTITLCITLLFCSVFFSLGSKGALEGLWIAPFFALIFFLNYKGKIETARTVLILGLLPLLTALAISDRRTGTEFTIIAIGCCSVLLFDHLLHVLSCFIYAFACYLVYFIYDSTHPFYPDPNTPYLLIQNSLMFISGFIVVAQSLVFKSIIKRYANQLQEANDVVLTKNKALETSNKLLIAFSGNLDKLVQEKNEQLKDYSDAIDHYTCSAIVSTDAVFLKVNQVFADHSGYTKEELIHHDISIIFPDNSRVRLTEEFKYLANLGKPWGGELKIKNKVSGYSWTDCVFIPIKNTEGIVVEYLYIGFLITERKQHQQLREKTSTLLENIAYRTSHQIRGPVANIEGLANLIRQGLIKEEEYPRVVDMLITANESLRNATTDLVKFVNEHQEDYLKDR